MKGRTLFPLLLLLASPGLAWAQGGVPGNAIQIIDSQGRPRAGATVTICTSGAVGVPCTPLASIFTDAGLTAPATNPMTTYGNGNLPVIYAAPGTYKYTVTGTGITAPNGPFTATVSGKGVLILPLSLTQGGFTHTLTGSTTAPRTWTLQDVSDVFVFRSTADTLSNKTLSSPTINTPTITSASLDGFGAGHVSSSIVRQPTLE